MSGPRFATCALLAVVLAACGDGRVRAPTRVPPSPPADAEPRAEPLSKYGNPESYVVFGKRYYTLKSARGFVEQGIASWYGNPFHGRRTSSGEIYDMYKMTAAHKQLPLPTYVEVRNLENGRTTVLRVNDRGPFHDNRVIDLSYAAALKLGVVDKGTAFVEVRALEPGQRRGAAAPPVTAVSPAARNAVPAPAPPPAVASESDPRSVPAPDASPAIAAAPRMYLQLGAFQDPANARRLAADVEALAPGAVHVREVASQGRILHRVQIGPIVDIEQADAVVAGLAARGITEHHFVSQ